MPTERVLIEIVTAANTAGLEQAKAGFLGFTPAVLLAGVALAGLVAGGKSMIEISDRWEASQRGLAQATAAQGVSLDQARKFTDTFIQSNKKFIETQTDVIDGYATLTRSGLTQKEVQRDLNIALDIAALKHLSLTDAVGIVVKAEHGRMRGLVDLGIVSKDLIDAQGNLVAGTKGVAAAMDAVEKKTAHGRDTLSDMKQKTNDLGGTWQTFAEKNGPGFTKFLGGAITVASAMADAIGTILQKSLDLQNWIGDHTGIGRPSQTNPPSYADILHTNIATMPSNRSGGRASGGAVVPGGIYTVGESGPETLVMGSQGGSILPNGGGPAVVAFVTIPPSREQVKAMNEALRRLNLEQRSGAGA